MAIETVSFQQRPRPPIIETASSPWARVAWISGRIPAPAMEGLESQNDESLSLVVRSHAWCNEGDRPGQVRAPRRRSAAARDRQTAGR